MVVIVKDNVAVSVKNVGMCFNQSQERVDNLKEYLIKFVRRDLKYDEFWALRDVDFQIKKGERLGVLGLNGSGKSTLLKVVSGVLKQRLVRYRREEYWLRCWSLVPDFIQSIQDARISICMERCWDIPKSF